MSKLYSEIFSSRCWFLSFYVTTCVYNFSNSTNSKNTHCLSFSTMRGKQHKSLVHNIAWLSCRHLLSLKMVHQTKHSIMTGVFMKRPGNKLKIMMRWTRLMLGISIISTSFWINKRHMVTIAVTLSSVKHTQRIIKTSISGKTHKTNR